MDIHYAQIYFSYHFLMLALCVWTYTMHKFTFFYKKKCIQKVRMCVLRNRKKIIDSNEAKTKQKEYLYIIFFMLALCIWTYTVHKKKKTYTVHKKNYHFFMLVLRVWTYIIHNLFFDFFSTKKFKKILSTEFFDFLEFLFLPECWGTCRLLAPSSAHNLRISKKHLSVQ